MGSPLFSEWLSYSQYKQANSPVAIEKSGFNSEKDYLPLKKKSLHIWLISVILTLSMLVGLLLFSRRKSRRGKQGVAADNQGEGGTPRAPFGVMGLSKAEVSARQVDFDLEAEQLEEDRQFRRKAIRQSLSATYNIDMFGIAVIQYLLDNALGALGTMALVLLSLILNVFQQMYTKKRLNRILKDLRPQANVIREGRMQSVDPTQIVEGDNLVIGEGDEFLVNGKLIGDYPVSVERASDVDHRPVTLGPGDEVAAGSYCLQGRTIYEALEPGIHRFREAPGRQLHLLLEELTPFQRFMKIILHSLFGLALFFGMWLLLDAWNIGAIVVSPTYRDSFSIIFGIAPTSLFFILIVTYSVGTLRIAYTGALVYNAKSVEVMANADTLCISKESLISNLHINLELIESAALEEPLSESLVRRVLGDFIHSMPVINATDEILSQALPGRSHAAKELAPMLFLEGWHGGTFDEPDLRGTYILGLPEAVEKNLVLDWGDITREIESGIDRAQRKFRRWFESLVKDHEMQDGPETDPALLDNVVPERVEAKPTLKQRLAKIVDKVLSPIEDQTYLERESWDMDEGIRLVFAYLPEPVSIYDQEVRPQIPDTLIPLANLYISKVVHPEAENSIRALIDTGLEVRVLSSEPPKNALSTALEMGFPREDLSMISGQELADLDEKAFDQKVFETSLFGDLMPSQKAAVIESLRTRREGVIMVSSDTADVPAMRQANLRVALRNSAQAALKLSDIVLLEDSLSALPHVMLTGQRLVNGILDVLRLYLSQTIAQLLLILFYLFLGLPDFPMHPSQTGAVSFFAIVVPTIFLGVWAASGRIDNKVIRYRLAHFILPSALTTALLAWGVYIFFINRTQNKEYAELAVTYAWLMAGWLRVLFIQPPTAFWVGGAPLRGDRRVIWVLLSSVLLFAVAISIPLLQSLFQTVWLPSLLDYLWIALAVSVWALVTRSLWRWNWLMELFRKI